MQTIALNHITIGPIHLGFTIITCLFFGVFIGFIITMLITSKQKLTQDQKLIKNMNQYDKNK
tara:strand:+ start:294 stop:479 length:186 start_codon:yes stop_codon:yes gene_type:complete